MLVCPICFCPKCRHNKKKIEIDDDILDTIKILNDKGYKTTYCCAGHVDKSQPIHIYISFDSWSIVHGLSKLPQTMPNDKWVCYPRHRENHHLVWSKQMTPYYGNSMYYIVKQANRKKDSAILAELEEQRKELYEWAKRLE